MVGPTCLIFTWNQGGCLAPAWHLPRCSSSFSLHLSSYLLLGSVTAVLLPPGNLGIYSSGNLEIPLRPNSKVHPRCVLGLQCHCVACTPPVLRQPLKCLFLPAGILVPGTGFKETAFLYAVSAAALTHALARACSAGRMERCTCDDSPGLESRQAWQWGVCGDNLKYSTKFLSNFLGPKRGSKDLRARADAHNTHVGIKVSTFSRCPKHCPWAEYRDGVQGL